MKYIDEELTGKLLTRSQVAKLLGLDERAVRNLVRSHDLIEIQTDAGRFIPEFALEYENGSTAINPALRGTVIHLMDLGLTLDEARDWLTEKNVELDSSPLAMLHAGHIHNVRRVVVSTAL